MAVAGGEDLQDELRPEFERAALARGSDGQMTTDFATPSLAAAILVRIAGIISCHLLDGGFDQERHRQGGVGSPSWRTYTPGWVGPFHSGPRSDKGKHNYVASVIVLIGLGI